MRLGKTRARGASHAARRSYSRRRQAVTAPRLRGTEPWRSQPADRRRFRLFDDPERVEFAGRGYVSGRISGRQETVLALFQNGKFDAERTRRNLFGFEFLRILSAPSEEWKTPPVHARNSRRLPFMSSRSN